MELSTRLQAKRKELKYTQEEIADTINVSRQTISNWETGRTLPDINSLILISDVYHISLDELIKGDNQMIKKLSKDSKEAERWFTMTILLNSFLSVFINLQGENINEKLLVVSLLFQALITGYIAISGWFFLKDYQVITKEKYKDNPKMNNASYIFTVYDIAYLSAILCGVGTLITSVIFYI